MSERMILKGKDLQSVIEQMWFKQLGFANDRLGSIPLIISFLSVNEIELSIPAPNKELDQ
jgi:hypothetical protein